MSDREVTIQKLIQSVERLRAEIEHHVPPGVVNLQDIEELIRELKDGSKQTNG